MLSFRSDYRKQQYIDANFDELTKKELSPYVKDNDYVDLWLREINAILNAKSFEDIEKNEEISRIIRQNIKIQLRDYYMTFIDTGDFS